MTLDPTTSEPANAFETSAEESAPTMFSVYVASTGQVLRSGFMPDEAMALLQATDGEAVHFGQIPPMHYVGEGGALVPMGERPSADHVFDWVVHAWHDPRTLDEIRAHRWGEIKTQRDQIESAGFPLSGKMLDSDTRSVQRINTAVQAAQAALATGLPFSIVWTCADGSALSLDAAGMLAAPVALAMYANQLHQIAKQLRTQIEAAANAEEVAAVTWPSLIS